MTVKCPKCDFENTSDSKFCKECGTQIIESEERAFPTQTLEVSKEELTTGSTFAGRYQIIEELGKGGMGKVYKVLDKEVKAKIALKLIKPEIASDKKTIERFRNELKTARDIAHKNVCRMYDLNKEEGSYYITMEYVSGEDLKSLVRRVKRFDIGTAISIAKQVCEGLSEAHKTGVIHRDLKPSNIMIDREGNVRIMDFGIARSLKEKGITGAGVMIGTPEYMSPEQAEAKEVDQRSDIYSLGVILYEMVTGRVPFVGDTALSIAMKHKGETPKDPKEHNAQVPDDLSKLILKCLEKDEDSRFQSAGEIQSELENIEKGIPTTDREVPESKPLTSKEITVQFSVKKIFIPAIIFIAVVIIGVIVWEILPNKGITPIPSDKPSVAVLPFIDLSHQEDQAYFCDGLADELINRLTRIERLRVPARTSSFSFKEKELDIQEIGRKLNVENVLEGSIRRADNKLRITVQLVKVDDGYPLWSERYERNMEDIFSLQDEISLAIVDNLRVELLGKERIELVKAHTQNLKAYELYLRGRFFWNKRTEEDMRKSVKYFEQAIEMDPSYALAYTGLADAYLTLYGWNVLPPLEALPKAKAAATKALEIDNTLAEAHTSLATIKECYEWDWLGAEKEFKRAIELNANYATAHYWYAQCLVGMGRFDEAITEIKRAQEIDPLALITSWLRTWIFYYMGDYDQGIEHCQKILEMYPNFNPLHSRLGWIYLQKGMYEEALTEFKVENLQVGIGITYAKMNKITEARQVLEKLIEQSKHYYIAKSEIGLIYFALGEDDHGFEWLEKAYKERDGGLEVLKVDPLFDSVRSDSRFKSLLKKVNLE